MRINDKKLRELTAKIAELNGKRAHVGVLQAEGSAPKRGPDGRASSLSLVEIAATLELGSPAAKIPARPFLRGTFDAKRDDFAAFAQKLGRGIITGKVTPDQALGLLGTMAVAAVKSTITTGAGVPPPLAPSTIAKRQQRRSGNTVSNVDRPLVDTGQLLNSITYAIRPKGT